MTDTEVFKGIESATMMLEELAKAFSDLESHINSSIQDKVKWDEIKEYFHSLEISLKDKLDEVKAKEKVLEEKQSVARALIAEKEAIVSAKELASLARLQELRDSAVSAIADARHKYKVESPEPIDTKTWSKSWFKRAYLAHSKDADKSNGEKAAVTQELGALRAVIKCIEEYKLHDEYPCEPLQKQVAQLEKVRANKKRTSNAAAKFQSKKYRRGGSYRAPRRYPPAADVWQRPPPLPPAAADHRGAYAGGMAARRPYDGSPAYEAPVLSAYGQQVRSPSSYHYPDQRAPTAAYGSISSSFRSYSTSGLLADGGIPSAAHGSISSSYGSYPNAGFRAAPNSYASYMGTEPPRPPPPLPQQQQPPSSSYGSYSGIGYQPPHQSYM